ncbi:hypothetical protein [uncultured Algoriphagus sp.]|uniref:hypothetical protein n=1 Tax=uncultured Algoriphagus sp. TaxID=417365 RepID=UPI0030EC7660|tara:strand:+ start:3539 stop:5122 length:1584 start_codon:yes stop_codon:yes gene_type:complete
MKSLRHDPFLSKPQFIAFAIGITFLFAYWLFGFDGITFSDDVYYLLAGQKFWEGTMEVNDYHFSSRWGAYVPSGLIGYYFKFDAHIISLISLLSYGLTLFMLIKVLSKSSHLWVLVLWFCTQIYFLHFLTKVYPDSLLVLWTTLVPVAATYRKSKPIVSGALLVLALFIGFITKETIVFLAPFPLLLFYFDIKEKELKWSFYYSLIGTALVLGIAYLGYFWIAFGDPLHRISSINAGHYISEYTYADKGFWSILERLTILPIQTFVERAYWPWMVFSVPGILAGWKNGSTAAKAFSLALACLIIGFWFMSSTLAFYNPIYLNPRHLIILIPLLTFLIASGWKNWNVSVKWKNYLGMLLGIGIVVALVLQDWKMAAFHASFFLPLYIKNQKLSAALFGIILLLPATYSIQYQKNLKQYKNLINTLTNQVQLSDSKTAIYTHSFLNFSKEVLFPDDSVAQGKLIPLYLFPKNSSPSPERLKVLIYDYYQHAYPEEQEDVDAISDWLEKNYQLLNTYKTGNISVSEYERK